MASSPVKIHPASGSSSSPPSPHPASSSRYEHSSRVEKSSMSGESSKSHRRTGSRASLTADHTSASTSASGRERERRREKEVSAASPRRRVARERVVYVRHPSTPSLAAATSALGSTAALSPAQEVRTRRQAGPSAPPAPSPSTPTARYAGRLADPTPASLLLQTLTATLSILSTAFTLLRVLLSPILSLVLPYLLVIPLLALLLSLAAHLLRSYLPTFIWWSLGKLAAPLLGPLAALPSLPGLTGLAGSLYSPFDGPFLDVRQAGVSGLARLAALSPTGLGVEVSEAPLKAASTATCALLGLGCQLSYLTTFLPPSRPHTSVSLGTNRPDEIDVDPLAPSRDDAEEATPRAAGSTDGDRPHVVLAQPFWRWPAQRRAAEGRQMVALTRGLSGSVQGARSVLDSLEMIGPGGMEHIQYDKIWELSSTVRSSSNLDSRDYFAQELWKLGDTARDLSDELQHFNSHANAQFAWLVESFDRVSASFSLPPSHRPPVPALSRSLHSTVLLLSSTLDLLSSEADALAVLALEGSVAGSLLRTQLDDTLHALSASVAREAELSRWSAKVKHVFVGGEPSKADLIRRDVGVTQGVIEGLGRAVREIEGWRGVVKGVRDQLGQWGGGMMGYHLGAGQGEAELEREVEMLRGWVGELAGAVGVRRGVGASRRGMDRVQGRRLERVEGGSAVREIGA